LWFRLVAGRLKGMNRFFAALCVVMWSIAGRGFAQSPPSQSTLFDTVSPQVIVQVSKHNTGADLVDISMEQAGYPPELLRAQIDDLSRRLGVGARGFKVEMRQVAVAGGPISFLKCSFAINGILDHINGKVNLQALVQAFTGEHGKFTVKGMSVLLDGESADERTVRSFKSDRVEVQGIRLDEPKGIEYRILVKSTEPDQIFIPSWSGERLPEKPVPVPKPSVDWTLYGLVIVGAIAVGALVYSFLLRPSHSAPQKGHR
jgi:hypothetical protein